MPSDVLGSQLGRYRIERKLGQGGMGTVYLAHDETLERPVALKVVRASLVDDDRYRRRLMREARVAAAVSHGNIATVYEAGEDDGRLFIAMEYVAGRTLAEVLDDGPLPARRALAVAAAIAEALVSAHAAGVVHRDLKPENTVLTDGGGVKVLDFGIARRRHPATGEPLVDPNAETALTVEGAVMGTPGYMSPEQALGLELDHRTDIFALGVLLYEMLAGQRPFAHRTPLEAAVSVTRDEPRPLSELIDDLPAGVDEVLARSLAKDPDERYESAADLLAALAELAAPTGSVTGDQARPPTTEERAADRSESKPPSKTRGRSPSWVGVTALALAAVAIVVLVLREDEPYPATGNTTASTTANAPAQTAIPITALPDPQSNDPQAIAHYRRALQAFHDGSWPQAAAALEKALERDPTLAAAHLRYALIHVLRDDAIAARQSYGDAATGRASLDERDRVLFHALEPLAAREPADPKEAARRLGAAAVAHPLDAELHMLHGVFLQRAGATAASLGPAKRSVALDPTYADGWQTLAHAHAAVGQMDDLATALDRCVEAAPTAVDCLVERATLNAVRGRCAALVADAKLAIARSPRSGWGHRLLAMGLAAQGEPIATVRAVLTRATENYPEWGRALRTADHELRLSLLAGDFAEAEQRLAEVERAAGDDASMHWQLYRHRLALYAETARPDAAAAAARAFFAKRHLWGTPPAAYATSDPTVEMLRGLLAAGDIDDNEYATRRDRWIAEWNRRGTRFSGEIWLAAQAMPARTPAEAKAAVAARPADFEPILLFRLGNYAVHFGRVYALAGDLDAARRYLEDGTAQCRQLYSPLPRIRAHDELGRVYEALGHTAKACEQYAAVLARWGEARPKSVTADHARARQRALGCATQTPE